MLKCTRREGSIILLYDFNADIERHNADIERHNADIERHENNIDDFVYHDYTI